MNISALSNKFDLPEEVVKNLPLGKEENGKSLDEIIGDRVYKYPEGLPSDALNILIDLVEEDKINEKELDYLQYVLITLPKMAALNSAKGNDIADEECSFNDYIHFQISRMKRMVSRGLSPEFCFKIRQHLRLFLDIK